MENLTHNSLVLELEGLKVTQKSMYSAFVLFLVFYVVIMVTNIGIVILISLERSLHEPMYILFCNLPFNDVIGNSIMIPRLLMDILKPAPERLISYAECAVQAFLTHFYGTTSHTVLMIMAFDRYVAICNPLRYTTIMSNKMIIKLTVFAWGVAIVLVAVLLGLTLRLNRCRTFISNPFCDNASLFKLSCERVFINNMYGLTFTVVLFVSSMGSIAVTYVKITAVCLSSKNRTLNSKALTTCSTHLTVYMIMLLCGFIVIFLHRFPAYEDYRKLAAIMFHIVPGILNPVIYGLQSKEIRRIMVQIFKSKKVMP